MAALRLLARRDLTAAGLTARLLDKGYARQDAEEEVERLVAERAVDDRRTALAYAHTAARIKGRGRLRIRRELEALGVAGALIEEVLAEALPADDDVTAIRQFLVRRKVTHRSPVDERRRVFQQLLRRGFPSASISKALRMENDTED